MNLRHIAALMALASALGTFGAQLTPAEALERAKSADGACMARGFEKGKPMLVHTVLTEKGKPAVYLFNNASGEGFTALSADDCARPLLGYSDRWNFSAENMPEQLRWWLSEYAAQIEYARAHNIPSYTLKRGISRTGSREAISPQLKTMWDQIEPFNNQCPLSGSERTWTGCVATAMAQVLKYWTYPEKGEGSITYSIESIEKKVSLNFSLKKFDWANMLDAYIPGEYTAEEADAVAYLMKACGYSVKMQYGLDSSGALGLNIGNALKKYFCYDGNISYTLRQYYSADQWHEMLYENLKNVGPVIYGGGSTLGGGHSFVCDGYDGEGLFHFNWGWSGMSDGYFAIDALNPDALGTGGGSGGGYNFNQDAIFGIQPPTGLPVEEQRPFLTQEGELSGSLSSNTLSFSLVNAGEAMWVNYNPTTLRLKFGAMFYPQGTDTSPLYYDISDKRLQLEPGYGTSPQVLNAAVDLRNLKLADGTYKVVCGSIIVDSSTSSSPTDSLGFTPVKPRYGNPNYFILKKDGAKYSVENALLPALKIKGEITSELFYGMLCNVKVTIENPSDVERTAGFAPVFMDSEGPLLLGESICVSIPPKSTVSREWSTPLTQFVQYIEPYLNKSLTFTFFDETNFDFFTDAFSQKVVLKANPGTPQVSFSKPLNVEGSFLSKKNLMIPDANNIRITGELNLDAGYFNYPVVICLCTPAGNSQVQIMSTVSQNVFMSMDSEDTRKGLLDMLTSYPLADYQQQYYLVPTYQGPNGLVTFGDMVAVKFADKSEVMEIEADSSFSIRRSGLEALITAAAPIADVKAYDLTGLRVDRNVCINGNSASIKLDEAALYIIMVSDEEGNIKIFKTK